jgi:hypothetical protein
MKQTPPSQPMSANKSGLGVAIGIGIGAALGVALNNIALLIIAEVAKLKGAETALFSSISCTEKFSDLCDSQ